MIGITQKIKVGLAIAGVSAIVVLGIWIFSKYTELNEAYMKLEKQKADLVLANAELNAAMVIMDKVHEENLTTIDNLTFQWDEAVTANQNLSERLLDISLEQKETEVKLDSYRARLKDATFKDPEGMARRFSRATNKLMRDFERATSRDQSGGEEGVRESSDHPTESTGESGSSSSG